MRQEKTTSERGKAIAEKRAAKLRRQKVRPGVICEGERLRC